MMSLHSVVHLEVTVVLKEMCSHNTARLSKKMARRHKVGGLTRLKGLNQER